MGRRRSRCVSAAAAPLQRGSSGIDVAARLRRASRESHGPSVVAAATATAASAASPPLSHSRARSKELSTATGDSSPAPNPSSRKASRWKSRELCDVSPVTPLPTPSPASASKNGAWLGARSASTDPLRDRSMDLSDVPSTREEEKKPELAAALTAEDVQYASVACGALFRFCAALLHAASRMVEELEAVGAQERIAQCTVHSAQCTEHSVSNTVTGCILHAVRCTVHRIA